jgi:hypothetical protein
MTAPVIHVSGCRKTYGSLVAVDEVSPVRVTVIVKLTWASPTDALLVVNWTVSVFSLPAGLAAAGAVVGAIPAAQRASQCTGNPRGDPAEGAAKCQPYQELKEIHQRLPGSGLGGIGQPACPAGLLPSATAASSKSQTPSGNSSTRRAATSNASRVLPTPPTPVNVTNR